MSELESSDGEPLSLDGEGPVYLQIKRAITLRIISGRWPPGCRVPSERELSSQFAAARMTVNRAIGELADEGLVVRRRRSGSFVARPSSGRSALEIHDVAADVAREGRAYRYQRLLRRVATSAASARLMRVPAGTPLLRLVSLHCADAVPVQFEDRLINLHAVPDAAAESFLECSSGVWLKERVPWTEAEHTIEASSADRTVSRRLGVPIGSACLVVERRTWHADLPVTFVRFVHPGGFRKLTVRFSPSGMPE